MKLDGVMLFAADLEPMIAFYRDAVGFRPVEQTRLEDWVEFDTGGAPFSLHQIARHIGVTPSPTPRETASYKPILAVDDLTAAPRAAFRGRRDDPRPLVGRMGLRRSRRERTRCEAGLRPRPPALPQMSLRMVASAPPSISHLAPLT